MTVPNPSLQDIKDTLGITGTAQDGVLTRLLLGAIDYAERKTRRQFSTGIETRWYNGNDRGYILLDEFQDGSITHLSFLNPDRSVWQTLSSGLFVTVKFRPQDLSAYRVEIINAVSENPYRVIGPSPYIFPRGSQNIEITANWGTWAMLPQGLQNAIIDLAVSKYNRRRVPGIRSVSVGGESISYSDTDLSDTEMEKLMEYSRPWAEILPD